MSTLIAKMNELKLFGMREAWTSALETRARYTNDEIVNLLVEAEWLHRQQRVQERRIKQAKFRYRALIAELDFTAMRNLDKTQLTRLADCSFIERAENIIVTGPTGAGKSYVASALGHHACLKGYRVLYANTNRLLADLKISKADNSYPRSVARIAKQQLIILDDFALQPFDSEARLILLDILEDRHDRQATIVTSQLPVSAWHELIGDHTIADAILDRLVHTAHRIDMQGESMRKKKSLTKKEV